MLAPIETPGVDYGPLAVLVKAVSALIAAGAAITLGFKGRAKWEPADEDLSRGPQRVASALAALGIVILWARYRSVDAVQPLTNMVIGLGIGTIVSLILYGLILGIFTYRREVNTEHGTTIQTIIGGLFLLSSARAQLLEHKVTIQELFKNSSFDPDKLWSRLSRGLAKMWTVLCYISLVVCGTLALGAGGMILVDLGFEGKTPDGVDITTTRQRVRTGDPRCLNGTYRSDVLVTLKNTSGVTLTVEATLAPKPTDSVIVEYNTQHSDAEVTATPKKIKSQIDSEYYVVGLSLALNDLKPDGLHTELISICDEDEATIITSVRVFK